MLLSPFLPPVLLQAAGAGSNGMLLLLLQIGAMGLIFWLMILRPQAAARKKHAELLAALKKGDDVMTAGGIVGRVTAIRNVNDGKETHVTIETGASTVVVERSRIIRVGGEMAPTGPGAQA
jgi:preprotein translocase subunit YajC